MKGALEDFAIPDVLERDVTVFGHVLSSIQSQTVELAVFAVR
jgi:hypothetical protein